MNGAEINCDRVVLITGAARRIGRALAIGLHQLGFKIIVHYNKSEIPAKDLTEQLNVLRPSTAAALCADLNIYNEVLKLATEAAGVFGRVDVLINNASTFFPTRSTDATEVDWNNLLNSNLKAPFFLASALAGALAENNGCIINLLDIYSTRPMPGHSIYSIAKAGNRMMVKALALEFAPRVRVNGIAPGAIIWPEDENGVAIESREKLGTIPMGKLGGTTPIVDAAHYLINNASYTTGQILSIDGGRSVKL